VRKYVQYVYAENSKLMMKKSRKMKINGDMEIMCSWIRRQCSEDMFSPNWSTGLMQFLSFFQQAFCTYRISSL
jgi:hypothetical protein